jgi:acyl-CoA synthetase (AMP-forming)/AMP-acid ligase II
MINLAEMLRQTTLRYPDKTALTYQGKSITWHQFYSTSLALAGRLDTMGVSRGEVVGIHAEHSPAQAIAIFAIAMCDAVFTIINPVLKDNQIKHQMIDADIRLLVCTNSQAKDYLHDFTTSRGGGLLLVDEWGLAPNTGEPPESDLEKTFTRNVPTDVGCIIYTSGSSGRPKGVVVPLRTLLDGARIVSGYLEITHEDVTLGMLPFSFDYGLNQLMTTVYKGARLVIHRFTLPLGLLKEIEAEGVTGMAAVPTVWPTVLNPRFVDPATKPDPKKLRYVTTAGGFHTQELLHKLNDFFPQSQIIVMYGLTESFRSTWLPFSETFKRHGSIGRPVPEVEILVLDDDGRPCRPHEEGELVHRGAFVTYGYLNNLGLNNDKFLKLSTGGPGCLPEMAVRSGDIVHYDEDGYLYYHGRRDMQLKCAGFRLSPGEVEEAALAYPGVSQAAAFGLPDSEMGHKVCLAYSTYQGEQLAEKDFKDYFNNCLPYYAVPRHFLFYDRLPQTANGKIDYPALQNEDRVQHD